MVGAIDLALTLRAVGLALRENLGEAGFVFSGDRNPRALGLCVVIGESF